MNESIGPILLFGLLAALVLLMGKRKGFFEKTDLFWSNPIRFTHLIGAFAIYFLITYIGSNIAITYFRKEIIANYIGYSSWFNFAISFTVLCVLALYLKCISPLVSKSILRRSDEIHPLKQDVTTALYAWVLAFPLVLFLSQFLEYIIYKVFQITHLPDQVAVKFLKSTFETPLYFLLAVLSIIILAPLVEETLFRGFLQSYIRKHLGSRQAIFITSACFAIFHYAAGQGLGNISIIIPLFTLSLFLGFLYEKQGSILAPITLHACFNTISVVNLYLFGGFTTGL